ncbi:MAG: stage II sporulation protein P [Oscillospiraceae bacterium]|nr:stage II sporulation protein P [Oscillospiraceae bacterium]
MALHQRTLRIGLMAILCALVFRLSSMDVVGWMNGMLSSSGITSYLISLQTGQDVRFSPSAEVYSPQFVETPPPVTPGEKKPPKPFYADPEIITLQDTANVKPDVVQLLQQPLQWELYGEQPTVLIVHTHTTESYTKAGQRYAETAAYRTLDEQYNMLHIGSIVAEALCRQGISVIHDRQIHDYPSYNGSYSSARKAVADYLAQYPSICLVLDLHRDASAGNGAQLKTLTYGAAVPTAQLMIVLGTNHPGYAQNLSLGLKIHAQLEQQAPGITRPLQLRTQRFNQDLMPGMLLVEVGAAGNTHAEAESAARQLAQAIIALARGTE